MIKQHVHTDITADQFEILQFINQEKSTTTTQIAQIFGVGKSAITAFVNRLVDKGLLVRNRSEKDRRIVAISLTEQGRKIVAETEKEIHRFIAEKLEHFNLSDIEGFLTAIEKLAILMENDNLPNKEVRE